MKQGWNLLASVGALSLFGGSMLHMAVQPVGLKESGNGSANKEEFLPRQLLGDGVVSKSTRVSLPRDPNGDMPMEPPKDRSVSACLLIKDDNDILNEWIAYHYHTLGLRHIIVGVDPYSETSPSELFQSWNELTDMEIVEWADKDYMPKAFLESPETYNIEKVYGIHYVNTTKWHDDDERDAEEVQKDIEGIKEYIFRQEAFLGACLRTYKQMGKEWVLLTDTDEYMTVNPYLRKTATKPPFMEVHELSEPKALLTMLEQFVWWLRKRVSYPCVPIPRLLFGSGLSETSEQVAKEQTPQGFDAKKFETLSWIHHVKYINKEQNGPQKIIIDVSAVPQDDEMFGTQVFWNHRPSEKLCKPQPMEADLLTRYPEFPFIGNHYLGSWERFSGRKADPRRQSRERYDMLNNGTMAWTDTFSTSWLHGFVEYVGHETASKLLDQYLALPTSSAATSTK